MINRLLYEINHADSVGSLKPIIEWTPDIENGISEVNVVTWDRAGLFHKLSGALNLAGYNILEAKAISRSDNIAIDTFYVQEKAYGHSIDSETVFAEALSNALISNEDLYPKILDKFLRHKGSQLKAAHNPNAFSFHPKVEIYQALSRKTAIIETQAPDTPDCSTKSPINCILKDTTLPQRVSAPNRVSQSIQSTFVPLYPIRL